MCLTRRGCDRLKQKRASKRAYRDKRHERKTLVKTEKIDVDSILAQKGIDSRGNRVSSAWGGASNIVESVGKTVVGVAGNGKTNPYNPNGAYIEDALNGKKGNGVMYLIFAIGAAIALKLFK